MVKILFQTIGQRLCFRSSDIKQKLLFLFPPSFELRTFRVLGEHDNHYTTGTDEAVTPRCSHDQHMQL